jgi:DNA-binding LacI/PurR family transcriptional regulator
MAGLKDIANAAGVSVGTASRILNQGRAHLYSKETRQRVLEASRKVGYRPNRLAQGMRLRKTRVVGFASPSQSDEGFLENLGIHAFLVGLNRQLAQQGYHVAMVECSDLGDVNAPERPWSVQEQFFDGLIVHYGLTDRAARFAENVGVPLIWWDSGVFEPTGCIYRDEIEVGRQVTRKLLDLGHRQIGYMVGRRGWAAYLNGEPSHYSYAQRFESYRDELRSHGLREIPIVGYATDELARQLSENKVTALIMLGSHTTSAQSAVQAAAQLLGWRIPQELSLATLDREARVLPRGFAVGGMLYDRYQVGTQAADMMLATLKDAASPVPSVRYIGELEIGDTIAPPGRQGG